MVKVVKVVHIRRLDEEMLVPDDTSVADLQSAVSTKRGRPSDVRVYESEYSWKAKMSMATNQRLSRIVDQEHPLIVQILPSESNTYLTWTAVGDNFEPFCTAGRVICIPSMFLEGSGIVAPHSSGDLCLYKRRAVVELWREIQRDTVKHDTSLLWIVVASGAGTSCATFAFAAGLVDRSAWIVVWLRFVPSLGVVSCVKFDGTTKATATCTQQQFSSRGRANSLHGTLVGVREDETRRVMVFFDGYAPDDTASAEVFAALYVWRLEDPVHRRLVRTTSKPSVPNEAMNSIKTTTDRERPLPPTLNVSEPTDAVVWPDDDYYHCEIMTKMLFSIPSWTLDEYYEAVKPDAFFCSVEEALRIDGSAEKLDESTPLETRKRLIDLKYLVTGGNAKFMFGKSTAQVSEEFVNALSTIPCVEKMLTSCKVNN